MGNGALRKAGISTEPERNRGLMEVYIIDEHCVWKKKGFLFWGLKFELKCQREELGRRRWVEMRSGGRRRRTCLLGRH